MVSYISQFVIGGFGFNAWDFVFVKCLVDSNDNCMFNLIAVHKAAENPKKTKKKIFLIRLNLCLEWIQFLKFNQFKLYIK